MFIYPQLKRNDTLPLMAIVQDVISKHFLIVGLFEAQESITPSSAFKTQSVKEGASPSWMNSLVY